jgi:hypothetical protein
MNRYDKDRFSRRAVLKTLGLSAGLLPLVNAEKALGQLTPSGSPKRLVLVTWCNGVIKSSFTPASGDTLDLTPGTTTLKTLEPLAPFVKKVVQPWGLGLNVGQYAGHFAWGVLWTGKASGRTGQGPSIDQYVSDAIAKSGVNLPVPLMNTGVRVIGDGKPSSWRASGQQNTWEIDPNRLFDRMFASVSMPSQQLDVVKLKRKSVIDFVRRELTGFGNRLGPEDRAKIDAHFTSLRDIEKRLSATASAGAACSKPMIGTGGSKQDVTVLHKTMFDLIAAAFRCDITRVATLDTYDDGGGDGNSFPWMGINSDYHAVAHGGGGRAAEKIKIDSYLYGQVAGLCKQMDEVVEGNGTMLDNSVVVVGNGQEDGASHQVYPIPFTVIGNAGGALKTGGRVIRYPTKHPHNKLLATIVTAMGFPTQDYGGVAGREGVLSELLA